MATALFHLRKGRCRKDDAARELARTLPEWCFAAPHPAAPLKHLVAKERLAMVGERRRGDTASRRRTRRARLPVSRAPGVGGILKPEVG